LKALWFGHGLVLHGLNVANFTGRVKSIITLVSNSRRAS
jgi:hypothetical protein